MILFTKFFSLRDFLLRILKSSKNSDDDHWNVWRHGREIKKTLYTQNNIFKKTIPNMRISIIYIFLQILFFGGLLKCFLASAFFFVLFCLSFFWRRPTIITYFFNWDPPSSFQHKEASYGLLYDFSNILYTIIYSIFLVEYILLYCSVFSLVYVILSLLSNFLFWSSTLLLFASVFTLGIFIYCDYSVFNGLWFLISLW